MAPGVRSKITVPANRPARISTAKRTLSAPVRATSARDVTSALEPPSKKRKQSDVDFDIAEEETLINAVVRCRPRNKAEMLENSNVVQLPGGAHGKLVELAIGPDPLSQKTYNFSHVFSPAADQGLIFDTVVRPILDQASPFKANHMKRIANKHRCSRGTIVPYLHMARPEQARHTQCLAT